MNLQEFKAYQSVKDRKDIDELIEMAVYGKHLKAEYEARQIPVPEQIADVYSAVSRDIEAKVADAKAKRIMQIKQQLEGLKTPSERKQELMDKLALLEPVGAA